jgi:ABC-type Na+ efflux pump permease subunit
MKSRIFGLKNILTILGIIFFVVILTYVYSQSQNNVIYNVAIMDNDSSISSMSFINDLKNNDEINLFIFSSKDKALDKVKQGNCDILYVINKGFENELKNGSYEGLISYNNESTMKITSWLNDYISLKVLKKWVYYDIYNLINENFDGEYKELEYSKIYLNNYSDNEIIDLKIENLENSTITINEDKKIFILIFGIAIMYVIMSFGKEVINEKDNKIIKRLEVSNISILKYLVVKLLVLLIFLLIPFFCSYLILVSLKILLLQELIIDFIGIILFSIINYMVILLFVVIFKEKNKYVLFTEGYILISILMSSNIFKGTFHLVNKISVFFPLSILIEKL